VAEREADALFDEVIRKSNSLGIRLVMIKEFETAIADVLRGTAG